MYIKFTFLACLDEVQEELLYYPQQRHRHFCVGIGVGIGGASKNFNVKVFYVMGKALSGELYCPCGRSCFFHEYDIGSPCMKYVLCFTSVNEVKSKVWRREKFNPF